MHGKVIIQLTERPDCVEGPGQTRSGPVEDANLALIMTSLGDLTCISGRTVSGAILTVSKAILPSNKRRKSRGVQGLVAGVGWACKAAVGR